MSGFSWEGGGVGSGRLIQRQPYLNPCPASHIHQSVQVKFFQSSFLHINNFRLTDNQFLGRFFIRPQLRVYRAIASSLRVLPSLPIDPAFPVLSVYRVGARRVSSQAHAAMLPDFASVLPVAPRFCLHVPVLAFRRYVGSEAV
jgi:hypothetical protein